MNKGARGDDVNEGNSRQKKSQIYMITYLQNDCKKY